jgi:hypothetical protein
MGQLPYLVPVPRGANTLNRRPGSAPITHNEACRKLIASSLLRPKAAPALPFPPGADHLRQHRRTLADREN